MQPVAGGHDSAATVSAPTGQAPEHVASGFSPEDLVITRQRAGLYVLSDGTGHVIGRIFGDYVVGFTAQYQGQSQLFDDFDDAKSTIAQLHAHEWNASLA